MSHDPYRAPHRADGWICIGHTYLRVHACWLAECMHRQVCSQSSAARVTGVIYGGFTGATDWLEAGLRFGVAVAPLGHTWGCILTTAHHLAIYKACLRVVAWQVHASAHPGGLSLLDGVVCGLALGIHREWGGLGR
jgi:hypothetical protein